MDINFINLELGVKMKETLKYILKKPNVKIVFDMDDEELPSDEDIETITIQLGNHNFIIQEKINYVQNKRLNEKYYPLLSDNVKNNITNLTNEQFLRKTFYLSIFRPFYGKRLVNYVDEYSEYYMSYNSVVIDLTKLEFDRFSYYCKYIYKLQQLHKLNKELKINQEFNIVFDDDKAAYKMYNDLYDNFKDIIEPFSKDDQPNNNIHEDDDDD